MEQVFKREKFILYKLLPCLIIIMFAFMCLYGSYVYADFQYTFDGIDYTLPESFSYRMNNATYNSNDMDYYVIYTYSNPSWNSTFIYIVYSDSPFVVRGGTLFTANCNSLYYRISTSDNNSDTGVYDPNWGLSAPQHISNVVTNYDILDIDGNVVFQVPPQAQETQAIIASQVGEVEMNKTQQEIIAILPIVLVVIVGLIALRKAIQFLIQLMKQQ